MINKNIFRAYDIRGDVRTELTEDAVFRIGRALTLSHFGPGSVLAVARDARTHSPMLADALIRGLRDGGVSVVDFGQTTTPMLYFALAAKTFDGGIMLTGSHNPIHENGLKICKQNNSFVRADIEAVYENIDRPLPECDRGKLQNDNIFEAYSSAITSCITMRRPLRLVVDCGNGVAGPYVTRVLAALGCDVIPLFCDPDGTFPNHHPDPTVAANLTACRDLVLNKHADFGIALDGDGDRLGVIDRDGTIIPSDRLLALFARSVLSEQPGAAIIGDVKCSKFTFDDIRSHGGNPIMSKTGHALIKAKMRETGAALAGEMSGHFFFKHRWYGFDDAIYAASRLCEMAAKSDCSSISELLADLPTAFATPEIRIPCPDEAKFELTQALVDYYKLQFPTNTIDGARVDFPDGWALMRASNTQPVLVVRVEANSESSKHNILNNIAEQITLWANSHNLTISTSELQ